MQHFLASKQGVDIPIKHLFVEYKYWIDHERPFGTVTEELAASQATATTSAGSSSRRRRTSFSAC